MPTLVTDDDDDDDDDEMPDDILDTFAKIIPLCVGTIAFSSVQSIHTVIPLLPLPTLLIDVINRK